MRICKADININILDAKIEKTKKSIFSENKIEELYFLVDFFKNLIQIKAIYVETKKDILNIDNELFYFLCTEEIL